MNLDRKEEKKKSSKNDSPKEFKPLLNNIDTYSISINPKIQFEESSSRYIDLYSSMVTFLKKHHSTDYAQLNINTEVSYPLKNGLENRKSADVISRIHFHGTIKFTSVVHWFMYVQPFLARFSIYEIDTINNIETWSNYITKDSSQWAVVDEPFTEYHINTSVILGSKVRTKKQNDINNNVPVIQAHDDLPFYVERDDIITQLSNNSSPLDLSLPPLTDMDTHIGI